MATAGRISAKKQVARQRRKIILFAVEIIIILIMAAILYMVMNKTSEGPKVVNMDPEKLAIPSEVIEKTEEGGTMHGYMNVALFGLDAQTDSQLFKGSRSDSIIIASINLDTGDIKLVSVYRDSYLNIGPYKGQSEYYWKCNTAYAAGGAEQAVRMLNMNLDMDIKDFVAVGYRGLSSVIDGLGGVYVDVTEEEVSHLNNYQVDISRVLKEDYTPVKQAGYQLLNGMQATGYCRIRATVGDDFKRAARQRTVLKAIEERAKETDLATLTKVFNDSIGDVYTSIDSKDILELLKNITKYSIQDEAGFPTAELRTVANIGAKGSCVIPQDLEENVVWLHQFLFEDEDYEVTDSIKEYGAVIQSETNPYLNK